MAEATSESPSAGGATFAATSPSSNSPDVLW
jgi:hypothetical protein